MDDEMTRYAARAQRLGVPFVDLAIYKPEQAALESLPAALCRQYNILPVKRDGNILYLATEDTRDLVPMDEARLASRCQIRGVLAAPKQIAVAISRLYGTEDAGPDE